MTTQITVQDDGFPYAHQRYTKLDRIRELVGEMEEADDWAVRNERRTAVDALIDDYHETNDATLGQIANQSAEWRARFEQLAHGKINEMNVLEFWRTLNVQRQRRLLANFQVAAPEVFRSEPID